MNRPLPWFSVFMVMLTGLLAYKHFDDVRLKSRAAFIQWCVNEGNTPVYMSEYDNIDCRLGNEASRAKERAKGEEAGMKRFQEREALIEKLERNAQSLLQ